MDFANQFHAAAQQAVLEAVRTGAWVKHGWIETMIKQSIQQSMTAAPAGAQLEVSGIVTCTAAEPALTAEPAAVHPVAPTVVLSGNDGYAVYPAAPAEEPAEPAAIDPVAPPVVTEPAAEPSMAELMALEESAGAVVMPAEAKPEPDFFISHNFNHVEGYPYRILVLDRQKNHTRSRAVHFKRAPTQEEFDLEFRDYQAGTHYIYVNVWIPGSNDWGTVTTDYVPKWNKEKPKETLKPREDWPDGKNFRVKFWDSRIPAFNYVYFERKPSPYAVKQYHDTKCFAVVEPRPEGV
ncbi:hypothetical protein [Leclercia adecarboxylata]|uniref:hypothetical protein n=1 Tax=Leclercia adecarboxylata TaxID=83655 RepID=UPI0013CB34E9|nr:hypothetical protein [Leclercia adecarboxylata]NEG94343.1 hypothetical protein [Leclercia adecarboxylata]